MLEFKGIFLSYRVLLLTLDQSQAFIKASLRDGTSLLRVISGGKGGGNDTFEYPDDSFDLVSSGEGGGRRYAIDANN